jgi:hypothetical protein
MAETFGTVSSATSGSCGTGHSPDKIESRDAGHSPDKIESRDAGRSPDKTESRGAGRSPDKTESRGAGRSPDQTESRASSVFSAAGSAATDGFGSECLPAAVPIRCSDDPSFVQEVAVCVGKCQITAADKFCRKEEIKRIQTNLETPRN